MVGRWVGRAGGRAVLLLLRCAAGAAAVCAAAAAPLGGTSASHANRIPLAHLHLGPSSNERDARIRVKLLPT